MIKSLNIFGTYHKLFICFLTDIKMTKYTVIPILQYFIEFI